jgi:hypothetical protein
MKRELRDRWVQALLDGSYQQGRSALRRFHYGKPQHCCLGVLCDIVDPNGWQYDGSTGHKCGVSMLHPEWCGLLGLPYELTAVLAGMNDRLVPFAEIAREIVAHVPVED